MVDSHSCSETYVMITADQSTSWQWDMRPVLIRLRNGDVRLKTLTNTAGSTTLSILRMGMLSESSKFMMDGLLHPVNMLDGDSTTLHELAVGHVACAHHDNNGHVR